jgi:DNA polymerase bacteriophage-type
VSDIAHIDFETYSELDIRKVGAHRYARHASTEVLICCYALPGMTEPGVWLPREHPVPVALEGYMRGAGAVGAHNANFERLIWQYALKRMHPLIPPVTLGRWVCTAAMAAASGLPRSLSGALDALDAPVYKNESGKAFINTFCKPRKPTKKDARSRILPEDAPEAFSLGVEYCADDVLGEQWLHQNLPELTSRERVFFQLDMRMNDRGLPIDVPLVQKALTVVTDLETDIHTRASEITGGLKVTQVAKMREFLDSYGINTGALTSAVVAELLTREDLPDAARELLTLRLEGSKASTKKLVSMLTCADPADHVVQGGFLFHGAHTGRYSGRLVQPHNFIRGTLTEQQRETVFGLLDTCGAPQFSALYDKPIDTVAQCMRGFIKAPEGFELAVVDYTAIEARILAWLAGEHAMLEAYFKGVDVYRLTASKLFRVEYADVTDEQRRLAKNLVLGCGYGLGAEKFVEYCAALGVDVDPAFAKQAVAFYRKDHAAIVQAWKAAERLFALAVFHPGKSYTGLRCTFYVRSHWLCVMLPSGRELRYPYAAAVPAERFGKLSYALSFRTDFQGRFVKESTYGGKLIENITQAVARDVLLEGMLRAERGGYPVIGTVHDEVLTLLPAGTADVPTLEKLVCKMPDWADGIPLAAKGFVCQRYQKG